MAIARGVQCIECGTRFVQVTTWSDLVTPDYACPRCGPPAHVILTGNSYPMSLTSEERPNTVGHNVSGLMRSVLSLAGLDWTECEKWGNYIDELIVNDDWLMSDNGTTWNRAFDPTTTKGANPITSERAHVADTPLAVVPSILNPSLREALRRAMLTSR